MKCEAAELALHARMDGELAVEEAIHLGEHLSTCAACRELAQDFEHLNAWATNCPVHPHEGLVASKVLEQISAKSPKNPRSKRVWAWTALVSGAAAACLALGLVILNDESDGPEVAELPRVIKPVENVPESATPPPTNAAAFSGQELADDLARRAFLNRYKTEQSRSMDERARLRKLADLGRALRTPGKAGNAALELLDLSGPNETQRLFQVASAVADPLVGSEIFEMISREKPELKFVPLYIAALDVSKNKFKARELLCALSGKKFGPNKEEWLAWWMSTRTTSSKSMG